MEIEKTLFMGVIRAMLILFVIFMLLGLRCIFLHGEWNKFIFKKGTKHNP